MKHAASPPPRLWRPRGRPARRDQPDDGDRARPATAGRTRQRLEQLPYWIAVCGTAIGLLAMRQGMQNARDGTLVIAGVLLVAALARLLLPERRAGMLRSRRRLVDVAAFAALGIGLLTVGLFFAVPA